jgi:hypothetical protein
VAATSLLAVAALAAAPESGANPITQGLTELFVKACVYGELRLTPDVGKPMAAKELGWGDYHGPDKVTQAQHFRITKPGGAILWVVDWAPGHRQGWAKSCHLGSTSMDLNSTWKYVTKAAFGEEARRIPRARIYRVDVPARGYTLRVSEGSLRIVMYDKPTAERMFAEWRRRGSKPAHPVAERSVCTSEFICG